jgi:hypothetical protein
MEGSLYPLNDIKDPLDYAHGLFPAESAPDGTTFRWSGAHGSLTFPYAANPGRNIQIRLRLANWASDAPPTATIRLNGKPYPPITLTRTYEVYSFHLDTTQAPNPYLDPSHVQVDIETATTPAPDGRQLGVALDWIEVRSERSRTQIAIEAGVWAVMLTLVLLAAMSTVSLAWSIAYALTALLTFATLHLTYLPRGIPPRVEVALSGLAWLIAVWLGRRRPLWTLGLAACGLWMVAAGRLMGDWQMDDAYISYRYAWNLTQGHGLVYNVGEVVEGYTNFLWTMLAACALALGLHPPVVMLTINVALSMAMLGLTYYMARRLSRRDTIWPLVAVALVAIDGAVVTYGARGSGMEALPFAFLVLLSSALIWLPQGQRKTPYHALGGVSLALATLLRPEGLLAAAIFIGAKTWQGRRQRRWVGTLLVTLLPYLAIVVPYQVWRMSFYGWPFPNTFYAKTGATVALLERGGEYVSVFMGERWLLAALAILCLLLLAALRRLTGLYAALALFSVAYMLYVVWAGGDHFPGWRFLVPVVAPMALLAERALRIGTQSLRSHTLRNGAAMLGLALAAYGAQALWLQEPQSVIGDFTKLHTAYVNRWGAAGLWLRESTPPDTMTAAKGAGAIAFYSQRPVLDVYGLNDLHIGRLQVESMGQGNAGHDKQDPVYVLSKQPNYILDEWINYFQPVKAQIRQQYEYTVHRAPTGLDVAWWKRKK